MNTFYRYLDKKVLPWPVRFLTNPLVILITFLLLVPLIGFADSVIFVLVVNSYMNVTSVGVSSIVLRQSLQAAESQEKRAQQDHKAIMMELKEIKAIREELRELRKQCHTNQD